MGKSNQSWDKAVPKRKVKTDEEEEFDWREEVHRVELERQREEAEEFLEEKERYERDELGKDSDGE